MGEAIRGFGAVKSLSASAPNDVLHIRRRLLHLAEADPDEWGFSAPTVEDVCLAVPGRGPAHDRGMLPGSSPPTSAGARRGA